MTTLPLEGIRVVEFAAAAAVPFSTFWLAAMGAEVIKVESYQHPDVARRLEPYADGVPGHNRSGMFNTKGINKRSCTINLANKDGLALALRLVAVSDVVVENFTFRVAERYDINYPRLRALNPEIILVSCSALGRTGPAKRAPGYNENISAISGLASVTGYRDGPPGLPGSTWGDYISGATLAFATATAIFERMRSGQGQHVDLAMAEALAVQIPEAILDQVLNGVTRGRQGNEDEMASPHGCYPSLGHDQWVAIAVFEDKQWAGLASAIGRQEWAGDSRFAGLAGRRRQRDEIDAAVSVWTRARSSIEAAAILQNHGVPAGPFMKTPDRVRDPQLVAREFYQTVDHPETGPRLAAGLPFRLTRHPDIAYRHAPLLGEHNEYVFINLLGMSDSEFADLVGSGVVY